ncbi:MULTISPECIES: alanine racemase [unclassified Streptomyces]|uniref:alanine racemase n=1 Tax=unclassified Streptomyces TaxID=2593676 RepID=UPI002DD7A846|nr:MULTISPECIES: alanine racemase [unclassified Streptomyces]WSA92599.1 alanine racemase [Streptomyces sp. NBC_01795]WSB76965.1 alanine racemase [Streptomyces sp. NBC_01775]WSS14761.1 alanine racemase [Streptomyces sp. NBC_01186]WSS43597.1 alanine racemase [Streptomyces sp. NBC_01187]
MALDTTKTAQSPGDEPPPGQPGSRGPTYGEAVVDLGAIAHNTSVLAKHAGEAALMAVVKADGFGHGVLPVARTALANGATWLGVTSTTEALQLRRAGIDARILSWMHLPTEDFTAAVLADIDLSVTSVAHLAGVAAGAERAGRRASIHLKIDTGLNRNGAPPYEWPALINAARKYERDGLVQVVGLWSHLVHADEPEHPTTAGQVSRFEAAVDRARAAGLRPELLHLANSGAILGAPNTHFNLVRAGIGLYGVEPVRERHFGLRPAMTVRGWAIMARRVQGGEGVSYGHTHVTERPTGLLLMPLGFADGIPRAAAEQAQMWVAGERRPVVGRIAMDQCVINTGDAAVDVGEEVVVFGPGDRGEPTVSEWAEWAGTIPHEVLTGVGGRVTRRYLPDPPDGADAASESPHHANSDVEEGVARV